MDVFLKATAGVLLAIIISMVLQKQGKDFSLLLILCVCCMVAAVALNYFQEIFSFIKSLEELGNLNHSFITILFKSVGIALLSEITVLICTDSGNSALGKVIQILSTAIILWICIPLFSQLMELVKTILSNL